MTTVSRYLAVILAALAIQATPGRAQDVDRMRAVVQSAVDRGDFSGAVLVSRGDSVILDQGYGLANREWGAANDGETRFRLASVSKQFTAAAALKLAQEGRLDLDAPVSTWIADAPPAWSAITPRHLMAHTAGLPNLTALPSFQAIKTQPATLGSLIAQFRDLPLDFAPGQGFAYSNSGYILLTAVIEAASGRPYAAYMQEVVFGPLGMADTGYDDPSVVLARRASGYVPTADGVANAPYIDMSVPQGAGGLYSTTRDMRRWQDALFAGRVLTQASLEVMTTPVRNGFGLGLIAAADGVIGHSGGIEGFNTSVYRHRLDGTTVIILANLNGDAANRIGRDLMTLARGGTVTLAEDRTEIDLPVETLMAYEGVYDLAPGFALTISVADGRLTAQATGQGANPLYAEGPDAFFLRVVEARITFQRAEDGRISGLTLHQNGRDLPAPRRP